MTKLFFVIFSGSFFNFRGGMSFASTRIIQACPKHNKNLHLLYIDANNLYGE